MPASTDCTRSIKDLRTTHGPLSEADVRRLADADAHEADAPDSDADLGLQIRRACSLIGRARKLLADATEEAERLAGILEPDRPMPMIAAPKDQTLLLWCPLAASWQLGHWRPGVGSPGRWDIDGHSDEKPTWWLPMTSRPSPPTPRPQP